MAKTIKLKEASELYLKHLKETGKKPSTIGTAKRTLDLLVADMGEDKEVGKILPLHVDKFFKSEAATMLKGKPRAEASILQIRRIVRSALVFWKDRGFSDRLSIPAAEKRFVEPKSKKKRAGTDRKVDKVRKKKSDPGADLASEAPAAESSSATGGADAEKKAKEGKAVSHMHFE